MNKQYFIQAYILQRAGAIEKLDSEKLVLSAIKLWDIMNLMVEED